MSSRLQLNPLNPLARSVAGTWPCNAASGLSFGPHVALGTANGMGSPPGFALSPAPISAMHATASRPVLTGLDLNQPSMELLLQEMLDPCSGISTSPHNRNSNPGKRFVNPPKVDRGPRELSFPCRNYCLLVLRFLCNRRSINLL